MTTKIEDLPSCKSVVEELINQYNPNYHSNIFYRTDGHTPELFHYRFNSQDQHYHPTVVIYRQCILETMIRLEKGWSTVLTPLYREQNIGIEAKITGNHGRSDSEPVTLDLIPGPITVVSPEADLDLSGLGKMVLLQVD